MPLVEICVENVDEALAAEAAGADRIELCAALGTEGGITPSVGLVQVAQTYLEQVLIYPMVRPRGGDFVYTASEFESMLGDISAFRAAGIPGVVAGCLMPDGTIDLDRMRAIVAAAGGMDVTCHRAFDMTRDPFEALEALIAAGVSRVLTTGQQARAALALPLLQNLIRAARGRIIILVCGDLTPADIDPDGTLAGGYEFHFGAGKQVDSPMIYRNPAVFMGKDAESSEFTRRVADEQALQHKIAAAKGL
ncbi:copper homeostasis protein CutC [Ketogulonicigenium vulgare]|uniref:PF03932 family protein CutC n=1 Tax=Ketogulonicigenium vulgare (strain WSH-001) TaxID=759362 RepID=F9Y3N5_KETVW|nr:copper homeostasis protein CutC [Ketogulonicigenium vulgare]ADO42198.1 copper homeostasis protein [Ketogulonicigenium vulgare Y25]AEM40399.1 cutC copper transporter [Ketogulonicigenium vulgare WSH-001]ALJ80588.1 copper homeostasis protein CutC [Ketogulonicigenium vulgare]ANW33407.1 copper homeostasis protein CutC [Ketogulonicigenium vulgare]AOZ54114.1 copper homeostasis protein [Ketogulonicigenium vulgare]